MIFLYLCRLNWENMKKNILLSVLCLCFAVQIAAEDVVYLTTEQFKARVMDFTTYTPEKGWEYKGDKPCVIDFYTTWCGPCKRLAPIMEELSQTYCGEVIFYKVDTEKERQLAYFFQISSIPQVLYVPKQGNPVLLQGLYPKENIIKIIEEFLLGKKPQSEG